MALEFWTHPDRRREMPILSRLGRHVSELFYFFESNYVKIFRAPASSGSIERSFSLMKKQMMPTRARSICDTFEMIAINETKLSL